jgi:hypothetical protein
MSSVSSVTSATNPNQTTNPSVLGKIVQDFKAIGSALQSGNLSTAQSALTAFQQALQGSSQTSTTQPFGSNTQANTDFQSLVSALKSGDLSSAQKAFASLQTDLTSTHKAHHHHHHGSGTAPSTTPTNGATTSSAVASDDGDLNVTA